MFFIQLDCPGVQSEKAGKSSVCAGCPNQTLCASGKASGPDPGTLVYYGVPWCTIDIG
jgi:hypothetical protein